MEQGFLAVRRRPAEKRGEMAAKLKTPVGYSRGEEKQCSWGGRKDDIGFSRGQEKGGKRQERNLRRMQGLIVFSGAEVQELV